LSQTIGKEIKEIHTRDFYAGNGIWKGFEGQQRADIITKILDWLLKENILLFILQFTRQNLIMNFQIMKDCRKLGLYGVLWLFI
jgi:hypothetical protein